MSIQNFSLIIEEAKLKRSNQERINEYLMDENEIRNLKCKLIGTHMETFGPLLMGGELQADVFLTDCWV